MTKSALLGVSALRTIACAGVILACAQPVSAQQTQTETAPPETLQSEAEIESGTNAGAADDGAEIIVTGSRIRRPNLESNIPVTSVGGEEFFETGRVSIGDVLNDLPALRTTLGQANSTVSLGTAGLNLLDLRGLGIGRTLVLQNGRRHVAGDILFTGTAVDVNQIPTDLIERVDVVTGGNSAIYGSDAIAGVVNFVLKRNYQGIQIRGQGGISEHGDAGSYYISGLAGTNFAGGRGNIAVNVEYTRQNQFFGDGRKEFRDASGFLTVDTDPAGTPNGSDGVPDRLFYTGYTSSTLSSAGNVLLGSRTTGPRGAGGRYTADAGQGPFIFTRDGTLIPITGERVGVAPYGSFLNSNVSDELRTEGQLQLLPQLDRYNVNLLAHFTVTDAFEPFIEAKYVRTKSRGTGSSGPAFTQFGSTFGSPREIWFTDNPYLTDQARSVIRAGYGDYYGGYDADENPLPNGVNDADEFGFAIWKNLLDFGVREEKATRETYRIVAGVRGKFNDDWSYEISANYGQFKERTHVGGNVNAQRYLLAIDAVTDPGSGNIVCRATIDPAARVAYESAANSTEAEARLAQDVAQCVPVNLFGRGNVSQAARDYITQDTVSRGKITQFVVNGFVSGDTSQFLNLPGGPIGFAVGAEYRRETNFFKADPLVEAGLTFYNALTTFESPAFEVKEAFGEIRLPILANTPFFHELTVTAAGRVADYKGATGTIFAWNAGAEWAPIPDIRFRGNYSRAVRAPSLSDVYSNLGQNFAPGFTDPCSARNIGAGSENREANCRAAGVPVGYDYQYIQSLEILSGGNINLTEEKSKSLTLGAVVQPRFLPGFSLSADYYDVTVNRVIASPSAQEIVDACYDAATLENQFCDLIQRAGPGGGPRQEIPSQILEGTLAQTPLNFAKLRVRGIDVEAAYRRNIDGIGTLGTRLVYTHVLQADEFLNPVDPNRADQYLLEAGDPKDAFNWSIDLKTGPVTIGYELRYIGKMLAPITGNDYENYFSKQGRDPQNADFSDPVFSPAVWYHDVRLGIDATERFNFYVGVDNVFDRMPPFNSLGIGEGSAIWNNVGRFFYAGATARF